MYTQDTRNVDLVTDTTDGCPVYITIIGAAVGFQSKESEFNLGFIVVGDKCEGKTCGKKTKKGKKKDKKIAATVD